MFEDKKNKQNLPPSPPANLPIKDMLDEIDETPVQTITKTEPFTTDASPLAPIGGQINKTKLGLIKFKSLAVWAVAIIVVALLVWGVYSFWGRATKPVTSNTNNLETQTETTDNEGVLPDNVLPSGNTTANGQVDSDLDGLTDEEEKTLGTDQQKTDSDNDGLSDREEVKIYQTNPLNNDTDGDGFLDGVEVKNGYDPKGAGKLFVLPNEQVK